MKTPLDPINIEKNMKGGIGTGIGIIIRIGDLLKCRRVFGFFDSKLKRTESLINRD